MLFHNIKTWWDKVSATSRNPERAETLPGAMVTAIVSAIVLLGVAAAMSIVMSLQAKSEARASLESAANNIETSIKADSSLATRILPGADGKAVEFHFQPEDGTTQCRVATWQVNDKSMVRTLRVFSTMSGTGCDTSSTEITGSTKTFTTALRPGTTFKFFNDLNREIRMHGSTAVFAKPDDNCPLSQTASSKCAIDDERTVKAWESSVVGKVGISFTLDNKNNTVTRDIEQNSVSSVYQAAQQAGGSGIADTENVKQPGKPNITVATTPYINENVTATWTDHPDDGPVPAGYTKKYLVRVNGADVGVQDTPTYTGNVGTSQFLIQVTKIYTRASITVTGETGDLRIDPLPPTTTRPTLLVPTSSWVENPFTVSWTSVQCAPASIGATVSYELYANDVRVYSGTGTATSYTPDAGVERTTFQVRPICNLDTLSFPGAPSIERTTVHNPPIPGTPRLNLPESTVAGTAMSINWNAPTPTCGVGTINYYVEEVGGTWATSTSGTTMFRNIPTSSESTTFRVTARCIWKGKSYAGEPAEGTVRHTIPAPRVNVTSTPRASMTSIDETLSAEATCQVGNPVYNVVNTTNNSRSLNLSAVNDYKINASVHRIAWKNAYNYQVDARCVEGSRTSDTVSSSNIPVNLNSTTFTVVYNCPVAAEVYLPFNSFRGQVKYSGRQTLTVQTVSKSDTNAFRNVLRGGSDTVVQYEGYYGALMPSSNATPEQRDCIRSVTEWTEDTNFRQTSGVSLFANMTNLTSVVKPPSTLTSTSQMFLGATSFNSDVSDWDTSNVMFMTSMFQDATSFNQSLNTWDVSNVRSFGSMFRSASSFNGLMNQWNTSSATNMNNMFQDATAYNRAVSTWNTSNVTTMSSMFSGASSFNQVVNTWNTGKVTNMGYMFSEASSFNQGVVSWDTSSVTNMERMFRQATSFNQTLSNWNVSNVTNMTAMFNEAIRFNGLLTNWSTDSLTSMNSMFGSAAAFNRPVNHFNVSKVTSMGQGTFTINANGDFSTTSGGEGSVFMGAKVFNQPLSNWNVSNVTNMSGMFLGASAFNQSLSTWNVSNVTNMSAMFYGTNMSSSRPLSSWNTSKVTNMAAMFHGGNVEVGNIPRYESTAPPFNANISNWNVSRVTTYTLFGMNISSANKPAKFR